MLKGKWHVKKFFAFPFEMNVYQKTEGRILISFYHM